MKISVLIELLEQRMLSDGNVEIQLELKPGERSEIAGVVGLQEGSNKSIYIYGIDTNSYISVTGKRIELKK